MLLAVSAQGQTLESPTHNQFGRCTYFIIVDTQTQAVRAVKNEAADAVTGAGTSCAQRLYDEKVEAVISGQVGPNAYEVLSQCGIQIYLSPPGGSVQDAVDRFVNGKLQKMEIKRF